MKSTSLFTKLICILITCLVVAPIARAVEPPPDGGYPNQNTAEGQDALFSLTTSTNNTAVGYHALYSLTETGVNTAVGSEALANTTDGYGNSAVGWWALKSNTTGKYNTALGDFALISNTIGSDNTAIGAGALAANTTGSFNIAIGDDLLNNTTGNQNIAMGVSAMGASNTGDSNIAIGSFSLSTNLTGSNNIAIGAGACRNNNKGSNNIGIGYDALYNSGGRATRNIALGYQAGMNLATGSNNICIGDVGVSTDANTTRIGNMRTTNSYIAGISGVTVAGGVGVVIDTSGHLGTNTSSARYKDKIQPMDKASESILSLKPVSFCYKKDLDPARIPQFGLVAEDVAKVNPDLVAKDAEGKPYTVRYEAVNAMLLNEFLKEHRTVENQEKKIVSLETTVAELSATVGQLRAQMWAETPAPRLTSQ